MVQTAENRDFPQRSDWEICSFVNLQLLDCAYPAGRDFYCAVYYSVYTLVYLIKSSVAVNILASLTQTATLELSLGWLGQLVVLLFCFLDLLLG